MRVILVALIVGAAFVLADVERTQRDVRTKRFSTAVTCQPCHANSHDSGAMRDHLGRGIAPHNLWRATMMANSARDPFFRAVLAAEALAAGENRVAVEAQCLHCHAPMASYEAKVAGKPGLAFSQLDNEDEDDDWDVAALARDGVSCTLCHQIRPGAKPDGQFEIGDDREIFGPFDRQWGMPMRRVVKYWPVQGKHILEAEHCATCHTSTLPGEVTFLEWRNSTRKKTCQGCHMPTGGRTRIASTSHGGDIPKLEPRSPVGLHRVVGGNTLVPRLLRDNIDALHVKAKPEAFDETLAATRKLLREETASVTIEETIRGVDSLTVSVRVENRTGHKLPTGHTSRRMWVRLRILDAKHKVLFAVGEVDATGTLVGPDGVLASEKFAGPMEPHRHTIDEATQVQIYEAVPKGLRILSHGRKGLAKDNRLLPAGWDPKHADAAATRPIGIGDDEDFQGGSDRVEFLIPTAEIQTPYTIEVALVFQTVSPRYLAELFAVDHPEVKRFRKMVEAAGNKPEVIARDKLVVPAE